MRNRSLLHGIACLALMTAGCGDNGPGSDGGAPGSSGDGATGDPQATDTAPEDDSGGTVGGTGNDSASTGELDGDSSDDDGSSDTGEPAAFCEDGHVVTAAFDDFPVPNQEDAYICRGITIQTGSPEHITAFAPNITDGHVHHMIIYKVQAPYTTEHTNCFHGADWIFQYGWAPGSFTFELPEEAGFLTGDAPGGESHYVLEIHYNNPQGDTDAIDSSGLDLCLTDQLRPNDASVLALGKVPGIAIPPGEPAWEESDTCPSTLTQSFLPFPLTVFGSLLHAHRLGREIWTEQFRGGASIGYLGFNDNFDFNHQWTAHIEGEIQPGDEFVTTCIYDSTEQTETVHGGEGSDDEMCLNFLAYYPALPIPACTSLGGGLPGANLGGGALKLGDDAPPPHPISLMFD